LRIVKSPIWDGAFAWIHSETQNYTTFTTTDAGCSIHQFDTEIDFIITLPRWVNVAERSDKHQKWWGRLIEFITLHEQAHQDIIVDAAHDFPKAAKTIGVKADCDLIRNAHLDLKKSLSWKIKLKQMMIENPCLKC
jgi:predicted secreted Zn-dependent protease